MKAPLVWTKQYSRIGLSVTDPRLTDNFIMLQKKIITFFYSKSVYLSDRAKKGDYIRELFCPVALVFLELRAWGQAMGGLFIPRHTLVSGYCVIPFGVCPSVRAHHFRSITWVFIHGVFFKFCIHIVIGDEWYGIVNGQNPSIFNGVTALFRIGKMVSGLLFLYCSWYLNETSQICCTSKVTYCD